MLIHTHTHCGSSPSPSDLCGNLRFNFFFPWSVPFTVPGAPGASCARRGVPGRPRPPLGLSRIYSVPQAINASRGFARCEGVSQIRVGRVKIKRMSLNCPPYSFHRQSDCKSERQPYPPLLCVHISEVHPVTIGEYCVWTHAKRCTSMARGVERSPYELDLLALVRLYSQDAPSSGHVQANPYAEVDSARSSWTVGACRANFHRAAAM